MTPRLVVSGLPAVVEFLRRVFAATGETAPGRPAEMRIGDSLVMISSTAEREAFPGFLYVYVDDADVVFRVALDAGATALEFATAAVPDTRAPRWSCCGRPTAAPVSSWRASSGLTTKRGARSHGQPTGLRSVAFEVDDQHAIVDRMAEDGYGLVGGVGEYEHVWRMASIRGPEGIKCPSPSEPAEPDLPGRRCALFGGDITCSQRRGVVATDAPCVAMSSALAGRLIGYRGLRDAGPI